MPAINRRRILVHGLTLATVLLGAAVGQAEEPALEDILKFGLRARRPVELEFVARVAELTDAGHLPRDYVLASFNYARKRRPKFPLPYFEFVIRAKAEELGVDIGVPPLLTN